MSTKVAMMNDVVSSASQGPVASSRVYSFVPQKGCEQAKLCKMAPKLVTVDSASNTNKADALEKAWKLKQLLGQVSEDPDSSSCDEDAYDTGAQDFVVHTKEQPQIVKPVAIRPSPSPVKPVAPAQQEKQLAYDTDVGDMIKHENKFTNYVSNVLIRNNGAIQTQPEPVAAPIQPIASDYDTDMTEMVKHESAFKTVITDPFLRQKGAIFCDTSATAPAVSAEEFVAASSNQVQKVQAKESQVDKWAKLYKSDAKGISVSNHPEITEEMFQQALIQIPGNYSFIYTFWLALESNQKDALEALLQIRKELDKKKYKKSVVGNNVGPKGVRASVEAKSAALSTLPPQGFVMSSANPKRGDLVCWRGNVYVFQPNGSSCYLYSDRSNLGHRELAVATPAKRNVFVVEQK